MKLIEYTLNSFSQYILLYLHNIYVNSLNHIILNTFLRYNIRHLMFIYQFQNQINMYVNENYIYI